jgi:hypothetical protein
VGVIQHGDGETHLRDPAGVMDHEDGPGWEVFSVGGACERTTVQEGGSRAKPWVDVTHGPKGTKDTCVYALF